MIVRNRKINPKSVEVQLSISWGKADVKAWMAEYMLILTCSGEPALAESLRNMKHTEPDTRYFFEHAATAFANYEEPWRSELSAWLWCQIVNYGYMRESASEPGVYYMSEKAFALLKIKKA